MMMSRNTKMIGIVIILLILGLVALWYQNSVKIQNITSFEECAAEGSVQDLEKTKTGMNPDSIKEASIDGYNGIEGIANANDPKKHYITVVLKDGRLFSVSTYPPLPETKELTDKIIE